MIKIINMKAPWNFIAGTLCLFAFFLPPFDFWSILCFIFFIINILVIIKEND